MIVQKRQGPKTSKSLPVNSLGIMMIIISYSHINVVVDHCDYVFFRRQPTHKEAIGHLSIHRNRVEEWNEYIDSENYIEKNIKTNLSGHMVL